MLHKLVFVVTLRCDLHCAHCLRDFPKQRPDIPLTGGEPHLHPQFGQIVEMLVAAGYTWNFVSHGGRSEPYLALLERYGQQLTHVSLSLDGATAEVHDAVRRRGGAFERVTASARRYVAAGYRLTLSASLNRLNAHQLENIVTLARDLGARSVMFGGTIPIPWNADIQITDADRRDLYAQLQKVRASGTGIKVGI